MPFLFNNLRVLELTSVIGQQCGKLFVDMGADVVKVEPPAARPATALAPSTRGPAQPGA